jgi:cell division protein ZapA
MSGRVDVEIFGKVYTVRGEKDPDYVRRVAEFVDRKMREIAQVTDTVSTSRIAILASLNIADELLTMLEDSEELRSRMADLTRQIEETLDQEVP